MNFFWSPSPTKRSTKSPREIRENSEQKKGQNSGQKFEKFGKLPREARDLISKIRSCTVRSDLKNKQKKLQKMPYF